MSTPAASAVEDEEIVVQAEEKQNEDEEVVLQAEEKQNEDEENPSPREFPDEFYDPLQPDKIMVDPVVNPGGDSYERRSVSNPSIVCYPNRALQSIIQREVEMASGSLRGRMRRLDESVRSTLGTLLEKSVFGVEHHPLPEAYYCIITTELMTDPVISKEGFSYEREAIENWIRVNRVSPMTRQSLVLSDLRENNALYQLIQREKGRSLESMHPSIRRWKASGETSRRPDRPAVSEGADVAAAAGSPVEVPTLNSYPTREDQIRARRQSRQCTLVAILFTLLLIMYVPAASGAAAVFVIFVCVVRCCTAVEPPE
jgi:hypothetical protein